MPQDVSNDPRILIVELVLKQLREIVMDRKFKLSTSKEKVLEAIKIMNSSIKSIRYSFVAPTDLAEDRMVKDFDLMANQFWNVILKDFKEIEKNKLQAAELRFIFNILRGFRERLKLGNEPTLEKAIDIIAVKVVSVTNLAGTENLKICRVGDGKNIINVVTNLKDIKKDKVVPAALLPPQEFSSEISEAMFCSGDDLPAMHEHVGERLFNLPTPILKEVNHHIMNLLKESQ